MKNNFFLDFVGIGAEKSGTTWLAECLSEHPEIFVPDRKEIFFFNQYDPHYLTVMNYRYQRGLTWYAKQFTRAGDLLKGEFSPTYIYDEEAAKRIKKDFPKTKIVVILRNPTQRAFSQYIHDLRLGVLKDISFEAALNQYENYIEKGYYHKHLKRYFSLFPKKQIMVIIYEDIKKNPFKVLKKTYEFLGLNDRSFKPEKLRNRSNAAANARFPVVNYFMMQTEYRLRKYKLHGLINILDSLGIRELAISLREMNKKPLNNYPRMKSQTTKKLNELYKEDKKKLGKLIERKLSVWDQK